MAKYVSISISILYTISITISVTTIYKSTVKDSGIVLIYPLKNILMNTKIYNPIDTDLAMLVNISRPQVDNYQIQKLKAIHRPEQKEFPSMPNERIVYNETRRRTRPWDNCWFSKKPEYIVRTVEEVFKMNPGYLLWCYEKLNIKWSTHTIKLFQTNKNFKLKTSNYDCNTFDSANY